jgi:tetratricopeptide (TPR) repeat protein
LLIVALLIWRAAYPATRPARLAVLPIDARSAGKESASLANGLSYDLSARLTRLNPRPPQLVVIPVEETRSNAARQAARETLGASHLLSVALQRSGSKLVLQAAVLDTATQVALREASVELDPADPGAAASSMVALVAATFNLPRQARAETVSRAAYSDYAAGVALLRGGLKSFPQAVAAFEKAVAADPLSPLPRAGLAEACYVAWVETRDPAWLKRGRESLAAAQRSSPDSLAVRLAAGRLNLVPGAYDRASQEYQRAIQIEPNNAEAWRGLARAYEAMEGRSNEAITAYLKAIELQPGYYLPHQNLGTYYRQLGNYSEAEKHWRRVVEHAPGSFTGRANLGGLYAEMGRWQDSERELTAARGIEPNSRLALNNLGALYQYMGRDLDAAALFEKSRTLGSESHVLLLNLGDSYRRTNQPAKAAEAYARARALAEKALADNPRDAALRAFIAYFNLRLGDRKAAQRELTLALDLGPGNKNVIRRAVICYEAMGLRDKSLALLQTATSDLLRELGRQPDLVELRRDPRFAALNANP